MAAKKSAKRKSPEQELREIAKRIDADERRAKALIKKYPKRFERWNLED